MLENDEFPEGMHVAQTIEQTGPAPRPGNLEVMRRAIQSMSKTLQELAQIVKDVTDECNELSKKVAEDADEIRQLKGKID